jgi:hypothetical protein
MLRTVLVGKRFDGGSAWQPRALFAFVLALVMMGSFACAGEDEPDDTQATNGIEAGAGPADPQDLAAYKALRDPICQEASANVDEITAATEGGTPKEEAAGLRQIAQRIVQVQADLAELEAPGGLDPFVAADERLRARRLELLEERAQALEQGDEEKAQSLEQELSDLDVKAGAAEEANTFERCP